MKARHCKLKSESIGSFSWLMAHGSWQNNGIWNKSCQPKSWNFSISDLRFPGSSFRKNWVATNSRKKTLISWI